MTLIDQIANASQEQSSSITLINLGADQIVRVVQTNSATSEESAATSEELAAQAHLLLDLMSQFNTKPNSTTEDFSIDMV